MIWWGKPGNLFTRQVSGFLRDKAERAFRACSSGHRKFLVGGRQNFDIIGFLKPDQDRGISLYQEMFSAEMIYRKDI